jgi:hypothetical protein
VVADHAPDEKAVVMDPRCNRRKAKAESPDSAGQAAPTETPVATKLVPGKESVDLLGNVSYTGAGARERDLVVVVPLTAAEFAAPADLGLLHEESGF